MKKLLLSIALGLLSLNAAAQTTYEKVMTEKNTKIETCKTAEEFNALANDFQRISVKETDKWLPNYYTALSHIQKGRVMMREGKLDQLDETADNAQKFVDLAMAVDANNSEIYLLQKMVYSLKMMVNPMERYMKYGMKAGEMLTKAEELNPNNPRVILIKAEDIYFTPEQYGGSKTKGMELFKLALEKFNSFKPKTALDPNWGKAEAEYFIAQTSAKQ
jgi:sulfur relay (sulfurtransferase) complex TusBCD TusD component (DsrE family)